MFFFSILPLFLPHFLLTSSQFVFEVCNIKFSFLTPTSEEIGLCFTLRAQYVHVVHFLTEITAAESIYAYHLHLFLLSGLYAVFLPFACITAVRAALKSIVAEQGQTTVDKVWCSISNYIKMCAAKVVFFFANTLYHKCIPLTVLFCMFMNQGCIRNLKILAYKPVHQI